MKCHKNPSCGGRIFECGRLERDDGANRHFSQFYERA